MTYISSVLVDSKCQQAYRLRLRHLFNMNIVHECTELKVDEYRSKNLVEKTNWYMRSKYNIGGVVY